MIWGILYIHHGQTAKIILLAIVERFLVWCAGVQDNQKVSAIMPVPRKMWHIVSKRQVLYHRWKKTLRINLTLLHPNTHKYYIRLGLESSSATLGTNWAANFLWSEYSITLETMCLPVTCELIISFVWFRYILQLLDSSGDMVDNPKAKSGSLNLIDGEDNWPRSKISRF